MYVSVFLVWLSFLLSFSIFHPTLYFCTFTLHLSSLSLLEITLYIFFYINYFVFFHLQFYITIYQSFVCLCLPFLYIITYLFVFVCIPVLQYSQCVFCFSIFVFLSLFSRQFFISSFTMKLFFLLNCIWPTLFWSVCVHVPVRNDLKRRSLTNSTWISNSKNCGYCDPKQHGVINLQESVWSSLFFILKLY